MDDDVNGSVPTRALARRSHRRIGFGLFAVQVGIILLVGAVAAGIAVFAQIEQVRRGAESDLLVLARSVATLPVVIDGLRSEDPTTSIQPVATAMQEAAGVEYITVVDMDGIRVAHPQTDLIGQPVSSDHSAVRSGEEFSGSEVGPMDSRCAPRCRSSARTERSSAPCPSDWRRTRWISKSSGESRRFRCRR